MDDFDWANTELEDAMGKTSNSEIPSDMARSDKRILRGEDTLGTPVAPSGTRILSVEITGETPVSLVSAWFIVHCCSHGGDHSVIDPSPPKLFKFRSGEIKL